MKDGTTPCEGGNGAPRKSNETPQAAPAIVNARPATVYTDRNRRTYGQCLDRGEGSRSSTPLLATLRDRGATGIKGTRSLKSQRADQPPRGQRRHHAFVAFSARKATPASQGKRVWTRTSRCLHCHRA